MPPFVGGHGVFKVDLTISKSAGLSGVVFAVVCTLRVKFAHAVSLGVAISDMITGVVHRHGEPILEELVGPSLHKWVPVVSRWLCRSFQSCLPGHFRESSSHSTRRWWVKHVRDAA